MDQFSYLNNANPAFIEDLYQKYQQDPTSIELHWRRFFEGYDFAAVEDGEGSTCTSAPKSLKEVAVSKLINAYRHRGHLLSDTNPVRPRRQHKADLELEYFGLGESDFDTVFEAGKEVKIGPATLRDILAHLEKTYCNHVAVEFMYSPNEKLRQWMYENMESIANTPNFSGEKRRHILFKIAQSVTFENFLQTKYVGKKRFSLEGVESLIPALDAAISESARSGAKEFVLGMAHRGRLNVLTNIFGKTYEDVFKEFEGTDLPDDVKGDGDVKYHLGRSANITTEDGHDVHITLLPNPSHLEAVNGVVQGNVYARKLEKHNDDPNKVIPILIHGDAAISGQGVNYELVNMSKVEGYSTGGTVHIVVNNQVGFTTPYLEGRSSVYCTDLALVTNSPVFHVNADDPEAVVYAVETAIRIRQEFNIDVYVDILGYRRYGHNEGDEPRFTQPILYGYIDKHADILSLLSEKLIKEGVTTQTDSAAMVKEIKDQLQEKLDQAKSKDKDLNVDYLSGDWTHIRPSCDKDFEASISTGTTKKNLDKVAKALVKVPDDVSLYSKTNRVIKHRNKLYFDQGIVDWGLAEMLSYGTLLLQGQGVRVSGQDAQRGTFSHRHAIVKDTVSETKYYFLNHIDSKQAQFQVYNSILSEYCVMGFEFGYTLARPNTLTIWEGQFGDFCNGAQIIIDQFLSSSESKWQRMSGLTLFLPHGYEGQGPEHSSARPERFLQMCAEHNMYVANVTTPANLFHLLRRQVMNEFRIPLILFTPKSLLRHPKVVSPISELTKGGFKEILDDEDVSASKVKRVVMCTGKVYYDALAQKEEHGLKDVAIVRLEQLYPLPEKQLKALKKRYAKAKDWVWLQEEPSNMGAWSYLLRHLYDFSFKLVSRKESASPASGNEKLHGKEQLALVKQALGLS